MYSIWDFQWWPQENYFNQSQAKQNQAKTKNITEIMILTNFFAFSDMFGIKNMYLSNGIQWQCQIFF